MTIQINAPTLVGMREAVYECNFANGWFEDGRHTDDDKALLHSEVSEMFEAYRDQGFADATDGCPVRTANGWHDSESHLCKPQGFGSEAADVLVRLLDTSYRTDVQFAWATLADVDPFVGFDPSATIGGHISALHALIAHIDFSLADEFTGASLDPTLSYLVTWCRLRDIDLQAEFDRKLAFNRTRGHKHGGKLI